MKLPWIVGILLMLMCSSALAILIDIEPITAPTIESGWQTNPCIDSNLKSGTDINIQAYAVSWYVMHSLPIGLMVTDSWHPSFDNITMTVELNDFTNILNTTKWNFTKPSWIYGSCNSGGYTHYLLGCSACSGGIDVCFGQYSDATYNRVTYGVSYGNWNWGLIMDNRTQYLNITYPSLAVGDYQVRIYAKDLQNTSVAWKTAAINFTVADTGVQINECNSSSLQVGIVTGLGADALSQAFGANKEIWTIVILVVLGVALVIAGGVVVKNWSVTIFIVCLVELMALFAATSLHLIGVLPLLLLGVIVAVIGSIAIKNAFT